MYYKQHCKPQVCGATLQQHNSSIKMYVHANVHSTVKRESSQLQLSLSESADNQALQQMHTSLLKSQCKPNSLPYICTQQHNSLLKTAVQGMVHADLCSSREGFGAGSSDEADRLVGPPPAAALQQLRRRGRRARLSTCLHADEAQISEN